MGEQETSRPHPANQARTPLEYVAGGGGDALAGAGPDLGRAEELCLPARLSSARSARHWVMNALATAGVFGAENQIVELLTGELVANAALHGPADGVIRVRVARVGDAVRVAVRDESAAVPVVRHPEPTASSGRGLELVESLAGGWGIERHGDAGKTVWFSVDLDPA